MLLWSSLEMGGEPKRLGLGAPEDSPLPAPGLLMCWGDELQECSLMSWGHYILTPALGFIDSSTHTPSTFSCAHISR